ncbi:MAG: hypothetical protein IPG69_11100 [Flavobacteriales bacterium]|nr:hypothetical protein [Flavobacteriales bacterium]
MGDQLRAAGLLPVTEPYTALGYVHVGGGGGEIVAHSVFSVTGPDAIVDWVVLELRSVSTPTQVIRSYSMLLQRDGDLVRPDGVTRVPLSGLSGSYYMAVRHRNHLGAMTAAPVALSAIPVSVDFTTNTLATYGTDARKTVATKRVLWSGNAVRDNRLRYTGAGNDRDPILVRIGGVVPTHVVFGVYTREDVNMDSNVKYTGAFNDRDPILENLGGTVPTAQRFEQLP